jgi:hypothetical protein
MDNISRTKKLIKVLLIVSLPVGLWSSGSSFQDLSVVFARQSPQQGSGDAPRGGKSFMPSPEWRPTHASSGSTYVGNAVCAECHLQAETQQSTPMAQALELAGEGKILRAHRLLTFQSGKYSYSITRQGDRSIYQVTDGKESVTVPLLYAFGQGKAGQTYVIEIDGKYYESRVSFYNEIQGLDYTMGAPREPAKTLIEAAGRQMGAAEVRDCFSCHATAAVTGSKLQLNRLIPGVTCEGCHGAGEQHVTLMKSLTGKVKPVDKRILNPGHFDTEGQSQFCGSCHRTWTQVQLMRIQGINNVRFQPYRIFNSKCYDFEDKRISCTACHNPHEQLRKEASFYDAKCTACHQLKGESPKKRGPICRAGKSQDCASCHMPHYEIPGSHFKFTDHQIRVVRPGDPYPN